MKDDTLDDDIREHVLANTLGGYDWGDPIALYYQAPPEEYTFTPAQLRLAGAE